METQMSRHPSEDWRAFAGMLRGKATKLINSVPLHGTAEEQQHQQDVAYPAAKIYEDIADMALTISKGQYR
jgi:hypothetical protein